MRKAYAAIILGLVLVAPAAAQQYEGVSAERIVAAGVEAQGPVAFMALHGDSAEGEPPFTFDLSAASMVGVLYEKRQLHSTAPVDGGITIQAAPPETSEEPVAWEDLAVHVEAASRIHQVAIEGARIDSTSLSAGEAVVTSVTDPYYDGKAGFTPERDGASTDDPEGGAEFRSRHIRGDWVMGTTEAPGLQGTMSGDFVMEIRGVDLVVSTSEGQERILTRAYEEKVHQVQPDGTTQVGRIAVEPFLRVEVTGATLELASPFLEGRAYWLSERQSMLPVGPLTLHEPEGRIIAADGVTELTGRAVLLRDPAPFAMVPDGARIALSEDSRATPSTAAIVGDLASGWPVALGIALALVIAGLIVFRRRADPRLQRVELAIEKGRYAHAAKLASRCIAKNPADERAAVARAVALSKAGHHRQVIEELEPRLQAGEPTDGVLHYLTGLAHMNQGARGKANRLLRQAAQLTPSLGGAVTNLLPDRRDDGYV